MTDTVQGYDEFYWLLNKFKGTAHKNESIRRKFIAADLIFDKTPRYVYFLSSIMARTPYKFIVTLKDPYEQYMSTKKYSRTGHVDLKVYKKQYLSAYNEIVRSLECFPDRIKVVKYYDLITDPESCMWSIKQFLGLQDDIELSLDQYNRELGELFMTKSALN